MSHRLKEDCGLDSLSLVAVIVDMEERLDITFDDGDLDPAKLITVSVWRNWHGKVFEYLEIFKESV